MVLAFQHRKRIKHVDQSLTMTASMESNDDTDDLTCPITLQIFRDPVTAGDGHVYERDAIVQWITERGTSPFTREPLRIEDLQSNNRLRELATRRRNSTVAYNVGTNTVTLPPIRRPRRHASRVAPVSNNTGVQNQPAGRCPASYFKLIILTVCCVSPIIVVIGLSIGLSTRQGSSYSGWNSVTSGGEFQIGTLNFSCSVETNDPTSWSFFTPVVLSSLENRETAWKTPV